MSRIRTLKARSRYRQFFVSAILCKLVSTNKTKNMKIAVLIVRILMGALLVFASVTFFFHMMPDQKLSPEMKTYMDGMMTVQLMPIVKAIELICGVLLLIGRYVALAAVVILPVVINIFLVDAMLPGGEPAIGVLLLAANVFLLIAYRKHYTNVFAAKRMA